LAGAGLLLVIGIIVGCCCWRKHKKNKKVQAFAQKAKDFADVATTDPNFAATAEAKIRELEAAVAAAKNASPGAVAGTAGGAAVGASGRRARSHRPSPPPPPRRNQAPSDVESGLAGYSDDYDQDDDPEDKIGESVLDTVMSAVGMRRSTPSRGRGRGRGSRRH
jgi:hypothetical protein